VTQEISQIASDCQDQAALLRKNDRDDRWSEHPFQIKPEDAPDIDPDDVAAYQEELADRWPTLLFLRPILRAVLAWARNHGRMRAERDWAPATHCRLPILPHNQTRPFDAKIDAN
jgi:hypothetical protein